MDATHIAVSRRLKDHPHFQNRRRLARKVERAGLPLDPPPSGAICEDLDRVAKLLAIEFSPLAREARLLAIRATTAGRNAHAPRDRQVMDQLRVIAQSIDRVSDRVDRVSDRVDRLSDRVDQAVEAIGRLETSMAAVQSSMAAVRSSHEQLAIRRQNGYRAARPEQLLRVPSLSHPNLAFPAEIVAQQWQSLDTTGVVDMMPEDSINLWLGHYDIPPPATLQNKRAVLKAFILGDY